MHGSNCKSVYCHWDGYPEHNGRILQEYYDSAKANNLVALGDLSSLRPSIGEKHGFSHFDTDMTQEQYYEQFGDMCTFYGRDRGETGTEFKTDTTFEDFFDRVDSACGEWYYVMQDGVWYCGNTYESSPLYKKLTPLSEVLESVKETV
jgi:hypothetical protein